MDSKDQLNYMDSRIHGIEPGQFSGSLEEVIGFTHPDDLDEFHEKSAKILQEKTPDSIEYRIITRQGEEKYVVSKYKLTINEQSGDIESIYGSLQDITDRKKAEEALKESNLSLSEAQRIAKIGSWTYYIDGDLKWSDNMYQLYGLPSKITATTAQFFFELVHPDDREKMQQWMQASLAGDTPGEYEFRSILPDGSIHYYKGSGEVRYDTKNTPVYMRGIVQDITQQKKAEEEIKKSEEKYRTLVEQASDAIFIADTEGRFITVNASACKLSQHTKEELLQLSIHDFAVMEDLQKNPFHFDELKQGKTVNTERVLERKDGKLVQVGINAKLLSDGRLLTFVRDITERKKVEEEIKSANEQLRQLTAYLQSVREEERKHISREIHDELGQQLTAVKMDVAWIDKKIPEESSALKTKLKNTIHLLDSSNLSIRKILNELRSGFLEHQNLEGALQWQGKRFTESTGIPVSFVYKIPDKVDEKIATCLFRIYQEALTNITRYAKAKRVKATLSVHEKKINLVIEDNGKGFDRVQLKKKGSFGILGMKERVTSLNGTFKLTTSPGKGTKISVSIPAEEK